MVRATLTKRIRFEIWVKKLGKPKSKAPKRTITIPRAMQKHFGLPDCRATLQKKSLIAHGRVLYTFR